MAHFKSIIHCPMADPSFPKVSSAAQIRSGHPHQVMNNYTVIARVVLIISHTAFCTFVCVSLQVGSKVKAKIPSLSVDIPALHKVIIFHRYANAI